MLKWSRRPIVLSGKSRFAFGSSPQVQMKAEPQYVEGPQALENFEKLATAILQAPKPSIKKNPKRRKANNSDKD